MCLWDYAVDVAMLIVAVINIFIVVWIYKRGNAFQVNLMNLSKKSHWLNDIMYCEFKDNIEMFIEQTNAMLDQYGHRSNRIYSEYIPIQKMVVSNISLFEVFSKELKKELLDVIVKIEDVVTDCSKSVTERKCSVHLTKIEMIRLIYKHDCEDTK